MPQDGRISPNPSIITLKNEEHQQTGQAENNSDTRLLTVEDTGSSPKEPKGLFSPMKWVKSFKCKSKKETLPGDFVKDKKKKAWFRWIKATRILGHSKVKKASKEPNYYNKNKNKSLDGLDSPGIVNHGFLHKQTENLTINHQLSCAQRLFSKVLF